MNPTGADVPGYRLIEEIGRGGLGVVYRAVENRTGRPVAVKVLTVQVAWNLIDRVQHDCRRVASFAGNPGVVAPVGSGATTEGRPWIATELRTGGSLLDQAGSLEVADAVRLIADLAENLAVVHEARIVHGDIKPQNVLLSAEGRAGLVDFGLLNLMDAPEITWQTQKLSPLHTAPEVVNGRPPDPRADVYGLGSTLYHLIAGQAAFHSDTELGIAPLLLRVLTQAPPHLPDLNKEIFDVILRAMAKQPEERFPNTRAFASALRPLAPFHGPSTEEETRPPGRWVAGPGQSRLAVPAVPTHPAPGQGSPGTADAYAVPSSESPGTAGAPSWPQAQPYQDQSSPHQAHQGMPQPAPSLEAPVVRAWPKPVTAPPFQPAPPLPLPEAQPYAPVQQPQPAPAVPAPPPVQAQPFHPGGRAGSDGEPRKNGAMLVVACVIGLVMLTGVAVVGYFSFKPGPESPVAAAPGKQPAESRNTPTTVRPSVPEARLKLAKPMDVKVSGDSGQTAMVKWKLPPAAEKLTIVLQQEPGQQQLKVLSIGATSHRVVGLDEGTGYCFKVGAVAEPGTDRPVMAWAEAECIRGAKARQKGR